MNIEDRTAKIFSDSRFDDTSLGAIQEARAEVKQLIRDVLAEVKPKTGITISTEGGNFDNMVSLDVMEAKIKELGL